MTLTLARGLCAGEPGEGVKTVTLLGRIEPESWPGVRVGTWRPHKGICGRADNRHTWHGT